MTVMESIDTNNNNNNNNVVIVLNNGASYNNKKGQFGDTTLTKVFVGGLAWETPLEALRHHFERFGDILEAVIISDKLTGRSKGYGFVTFKEAEAAKKACEDATPIINGRRANCNLAALGARRPPRSASATPPPPQQQPTNIGGPRPTTAPSHVQWYYRPATTTPFHPHHHQAVPFYGYSPAYVATDVNYNNKLNYSGGGGGGRYMNGQVQHPEMYRQVQTMIGGNTVMPYYPVYYHQQQHLQFHHHHHHHGGVGVMGLPHHMLPPTSASPITPLSLVSRPSPLSISSPSVAYYVFSQVVDINHSQPELHQVFLLALHVRKYHCQQSNSFKNKLMFININIIIIIISNLGYDIIRCDRFKCNKKMVKGNKNNSQR